MLKNIFILILIIILMALGAAAALRIVLWSVGMLFRVAFNLILVIAAFMGVMFLIRKLRT
jgi:hypothetical protein